MFRSRLAITLFLCLLHQSSCQDGQSFITVPPQNATVRTGSFVFLTCETREQYTGPFTWRFIGSSVGGDSIYFTPPYQPSPKFPQNRFQRVGEHGLNITSLQVLDGGTYDCNYVSGDAHAFADIFVIDPPIASVLPSVVDVGQTVTFNCTVMFGGPHNDPLFVVPDQFPQLSLLLGNDNYNHQATLYPVVGTPGKIPHSLSRSMTYVVTPADVNKQLTCVVSTARPAFTLTSSAVISVRSPVYDVIITPKETQYTVNDTINCTAVSYPSPGIQWIRVNSSSKVDMFEGSILFVSADMKGYNVWRCEAANSLNSHPVTAQLIFTVGDSASQSGTVTTSNTVGLAIGITIGLTLLIIVILLAVFFIIIRQNQKSQPDSKKNKEETTTDSSQAFIYKPNNSRPSSNVDDGSAPKPVPRQRIPSADTSLDTSINKPPAYGDLGASLIRASTDSIPTLDYDGGKPSSRPVEKPRPRANPPRGSTESLDNDGRPKPKERPRTDFKGSNESLDKSLENRPQPKERPRPNPRGSNESLDRLKSRESSEFSADKPRPPTAPKPAKKGDVTFDDSRSGSKAMKTGGHNYDTDV